MDQLPWKMASYITRAVSSRLYLVGNLKSAMYANHYNEERHWNNALKRNVIKAVQLNCMQLLKAESI
jgi:hypothetical protein